MEKTEVETPLSFESPESSAVASASYDPDTHLLTLSLKRPNKDQPERVVQYTYAGFPEGNWKLFVEATSKGRYFSEVVRPLFVGIPK